MLVAPDLKDNDFPKILFSYASPTPPGCCYFYSFLQGFIQMLFTFLLTSPFPKDTAHISRIS